MNIRSHIEQLALVSNFGTASGVDNLLEKLAQRIKEKTPQTNTRIENGHLVVPYNNLQFLAAQMAVETAECHERLKNKIQFEWQGNKFGYSQVVFNLEKHAIDLSRIAFRASIGLSNSLPKPIVITTAVLGFNRQKDYYECRPVHGVNKYDDSLDVTISLSHLGPHQGLKDIKGADIKYIIAAPNIALIQKSRDNWRDIALKVAVQAGSIAVWKPKPIDVDAVSNVQAQRFPPASVFAKPLL